MERADVIIIRSKRRTLGLRVTDDGLVEVRAPLRCPKRDIDAFVTAYSGWIAERQKQALELKSRAEAAGALTEKDIAALAASMKTALPGKLDCYSSILGVSYGRVTVRCQKSKWGSCTNNGNLNFNCLLMLAPDEVLDYVIVHELCHIKHHDHSKAFWAEVAGVLPDYKARRAWLKKNGALLTARANAGKASGR